MNWIYCGEIKVLESAGTPKTKLKNDCWHESSIFTNACEKAMEAAKEGGSAYLARLDYQNNTRNICKCLRKHPQETPQCHMQWLINLYYFAVTEDIALLKEDTLHALSVAVQVSNELPGWKLVNSAYNGVLESSRLCRFLVKLYTANWSYSLAADLSRRKDLQIHHKFANTLMCDLSLTLEGTEKQRERLRKENRTSFLNSLTMTSQLESQLSASQAHLADARAKIKALEQEKSMGIGNKRVLVQDDEYNVSSKRRRTSSNASASSSRTLI